MITNNLSYLTGEQDANSLKRKGESLADFLNHATGAKQKRVLRLLKICNQLRRTLPTLRPASRVIGGPQAGKLLYDIAQNVRTRKLWREFNKSLRFSYSFALDRYMVKDSEQEPYLPIELGCRNPGKLSGADMISEGHATELLLALARADCLSRFRQCPGPDCGRWFMATGRKTYHNPKCSQARYRRQLTKRDRGYFRRAMRAFRKRNGL